MEDKMKKNILVLLLSIFFFSLIAIEVPPGAVSGSWSISDSPYIVRGNISIQSGDTLEIDRGVVVYFGFGAQLDVQGRLLVNGTNESRVIFSTLSEQTIWSGIHFDRSSDSKINYATFSNVRNSVTIELDSCSNFELSNCVFSNPEGNTFENNASIISIVNSQYIDIYNNEFSNNNAIGDATNLVNIQNTNRLKFVSNNIFNNNGYSALFHSNSCGALLFEHNEVNNNTSRQATIKIINSITDFTQINGNTIENNTNTGSFGGALSLDGKGFDVSNNIITNNQASQGGGIYLDFHTSSNPNSIIFNNNRIYENTAQYGGGVHVLGKAFGAVLFKENDICMNSASVTGGGMYLEGLGDTYDNAGLVGNHITFNSAPAGGGIFALECSSLFIRNCNIVYNRGEGLTIDNGLTACNVNAYNTNIWGNSGYQVKIHGNLSNYLISSFDYCNIQGLDSGIIGYTSFYDYSHLIDVEPDFVDKYLFNWHLSDPNSDLIHGGPVDHFNYALGPFIGVYTYNSSFAISTYSRDLPVGWTWLSFPILPRDEETDEPVDISYITDMLDPDGSEIQHQYESIVYNEFWTVNSLLNTVSSSLGYKIETSADCNITTSGTTLNPNTLITLYPFRENWIGYFIPRTMLIEDALGEQTMSQLRSIKTQWWSMQRHGNAWIQNSQPKTLSFGDMVILETSVEQVFDFSWQNGVPQLRSEIPLAQLYTYEEQANYVPVFVELDTDNPPLEIGLFVNGICRGAAVYDSDITEIKAYLLQEDLDQEIYFDFAYHTKSAPIKPNNYLVVNSYNMQEENIPLIVQAGKPYYYIKFSKDDELANEKVYLQLNQNYPNPFNPNTNISFYISKEEHVRLSIYNIKGQKVNELCNGIMSAGNHILEWNGKDSNGKDVTSGIYFYKLDTKISSIQKKMTLIK